ncbi:hypothetical protein G5C60_34645 [Streptomyces sp. HC44]|uniref:Uncharacterized protein n=1 Tax=Streptomyces scabichelini TaxID=2711217 RepID=A0A6G4VFQ9_9ACTN|nr:hypothetical protein [Streptomyces scabichelini]NGO12613.1 hypothetical protein [Streptomyces scabichelini]
MKIGPVLRDLHHDERELARELLHTAERHKTSHDIHHLALDLAAWSRRHIRELAELAERYDVALDPEPDDGPGPVGRLREKGSEIIGRRSEAGRRKDEGLVLLRDLRGICQRASAVSVDWELVAQAAQAAQATSDDRLLDLAQRCHPDTLRQLRWANAELKEISPQVLTS